MSEMMNKKTLSIIATTATVLLLGVAAWAALSGASWYAVLAPVTVALLVAFVAPSVVGRPRSSTSPGKGVDAAEVRQWRVDHPGATISDAVDAVERR